jgi:hypothetical protein
MASFIQNLELKHEIKATVDEGEVADALMKAFTNAGFKVQEKLHGYLVKLPKLGAMVTLTIDDVEEYNPKIKKGLGSLYK